MKIVNVLESFGNSALTKTRTKMVPGIFQKPSIFIFETPKFQKIYLLGYLIFFTDFFVKNRYDFSPWK